MAQTTLEDEKADPAERGSARRLGTLVFQPMHQPRQRVRVRSLTTAELQGVALLWLLAVVVGVFVGIVAYDPRDLSLSFLAWAFAAYAAVFLAGLVEEVRRRFRLLARAVGMIGLVMLVAFAVAVIGAASGWWAEPF
ncbi:MAG: hypothetical protein GC199_00080 [Alphaproteobacteria bacterium]|nr:hypothetical protein [Alphaproteobacteria bacterium]